MVKTITKALLRRRVQRGAKLLDQTIPDWPKKLARAMFAGRFQMSNWDRCVAGTLEAVRSYQGNKDKLVLAFNGTEIVGLEKAISHGFFMQEDGFDENSIDGDGYEVLGALWREEVEQRLVA